MFPMYSLSLRAIRRHMHWTKMAASSVPSAGSYRAQSRRKEARPTSANVSFGRSSASQWPDGKARPDTWVARSRQTARTSYWPTMPLAPQSTSAGHTTFLFMSGCVMRHVDRRGRPVVLASGMNGGWIAEAPTIFRVGFRLDGRHGRTHENLQKRRHYFRSKSQGTARLESERTNESKQKRIVDRPSCTCSGWGRCPS